MTNVMTFGEMLNFTNPFKEIKEGLSCLKDQRLARMMTELEQIYGIPALLDEVFGQENPYVMQLYRTIAEERSL